MAGLSVISAERFADPEHEAAVVEAGSAGAAGAFS